MSLKKILVVDDSMSSRLVLRKMLQEYNVNVTMVESVKEALDYLSRHSTDVIFLDHLMPGLDGLQALKILKEDPATKSIPVVMFTAIDDEQYSNSIQEQGAVGVLPKPFSEDALFDIMQKLRILIEQHETQPKQDTITTTLSSLDTLDKEALQTLLQPVVVNLIQQQIDTLNKELDDKLAQQQTFLEERARSHLAIDSTAIEQQIHTILASTIQQSNADIGQKLSQQTEQQLQTALTAHSDKFEQRFKQLEQWVSDELSEINKTLADLAVSADASDSANTLAADLDPIVAENTQGAWYDSAEQLASEISVDDLPDQAQLPSDESRVKPASFIIFGLIAAAILTAIIVALVYFLRS